MLDLWLWFTWLIDKDGKILSQQTVLREVRSFNVLSLATLSTKGLGGQRWRFSGQETKVSG